jgi:NAD(P)-dependent dehydrogenase (short-subunit alcohol dehydrogenase family)
MHPADDNALTTEEAVWDLTNTVNVKGVWWGCKYGIMASASSTGRPVALFAETGADFQLSLPPQVRKNPTDESKNLRVGGSIINVASFVAILGAATPQLAYTASKGAVLAMTRELAVVHAREGIRFNALCPGPIRTPLLMDFLDTAEKKERRLIHVPMGRFGEAIEQARGALFRASKPVLASFGTLEADDYRLLLLPVASDDSSFVTGTDFKVDGGVSAAYVTPLGEQILPPPAGMLA